MEKECFKCHQVKSLSEFYIHPQMGDGHLGKCKECAKIDAFEHRCANIEKVKEYDRKRFKTPERKEKAKMYLQNSRKNNPEKHRARNAVAYALRSGSIKKLPCEVCGKAESQAHHADYLKPLEVSWLCFVHHRKTHGQMVEA